MYVDVHTHLTHRRFAGEVAAVVARASDVGVGAIVVNGLEPLSIKIVEPPPAPLAATPSCPVRSVCGSAQACPPRRCCRPASSARVRRCRLFRRRR